MLLRRVAYPSLAIMALAALFGLAGVPISGGNDNAVHEFDALTATSIGKPQLVANAVSFRESCGFGSEELRLRVDKSAASENRSGGKESFTLASGCGFSVEALRNPEALLSLATECTFVVATEPQPDGSFGAEVRPDGDCEGVGALVEVWDKDPKGLEPSFAVNKEGVLNIRTKDVPSLASSTAWSSWKDARIVGHEALHVPVYLAYIQMQVNYNGSTVTDANTQHWEWAGGAIDSFDIEFQTDGDYQEGGGASWYAYNYVHNHTCGFPTCAQPDVDAWIQPQLRGYPNGSISCLFWNSWGGNPGYYGIHNHNYCQNI